MAETQMQKFDPDRQLPAIVAGDAAQLEAEGFELDAPMLDFAAGDDFFAYYCGWGDPIVIDDRNAKPDPTTGELPQKTLRTHRFRSQGGRYFTILAATQLSRKLSDRVVSRHGLGVLCHVARGDDKDTSTGKRVTQYLVEPNPRGKLDIEGEAEKIAAWHAELQLTTF